MFGCCNSFSKQISRTAVDETPSSWLHEQIPFTATISPVTLCSALYTTPYVPEQLRSILLEIRKPFLSNELQNVQRAKNPKDMSTIAQI